MSYEKSSYKLKKLSKCHIIHILNIKKFLNVLIWRLNVLISTLLIEITPSLKLKETMTIYLCKISNILLRYRNYQVHQQLL